MLDVMVRDLSTYVDALPANIRRPVVHALFRATTGRGALNSAVEVVLARII